MNYLFLHGLAGEPDNFLETSKILRENDNNYLIPRIDYLGPYDSLDELAAKVIKPYDQFLQETIVIGSSLGCTLALSTGSYFRRVVLTGPHTKTQLGKIPRSREGFDREMGRMIFYAQNYRNLSPELKDHYWEIWFNFISKKGSLQKLKKIKNMADKYDQDTRFKDLQDRITIVAGKEDQLSPISYFEELRKRYPMIILYVLDECGHALPIEKPKELAEILLVEPEISRENI